MEILFSTPAIMLYTIILTLVTGLLVQKKIISQPQAQIALDLFSWIEKNYLGSLNIKGQEKLNLFINNFVVDYEKKFGKAPTEEAIQQAIDYVENLVSKQNEAKALVAPDLTQIS